MTGSEAIQQERRFIRNAHARLITEKFAERNILVA